jgi:adenylate kinase family enzyme
MTTRRHTSLCRKCFFSIRTVLICFCVALRCVLCFSQFCPLDSILCLSADDATVRTRLALRGRSDDAPAVVERRLRGYKEDTEPAMQAWRQRICDEQTTRRDSAVAAPSTAVASASDVASPSSGTPTVHAFYAVDGRPSIDEVYAVVKPLFVQFLKSHL